jgi:hypothetical protein
MGFGFDIGIEQRRQGVIARVKIQKGFFAEGFDDIYRGFDDRQIIGLTISRQFILKVFRPNAEDKFISLDRTHF